MYKISEDAIHRLKDANQRFEQAFLRRDIRGCRSCDNEFHDIIIKLAGNDFLSFFCETLSGHAARIENIYFSKVGDMDELIHEGKATVDVLPTESAWFGATYREDKPFVAAAIRRLVDVGEYPSNLFAPEA